VKDESGESRLLLDLVRAWALTVLY
jgi:hypothetical protein